MTPNALNYHHLLYFWAIAKEGSLRMASDLLHVSQPSISAQLKLLEESLGAPLFTRTTRRLVLNQRMSTSNVVICAAPALAKSLVKNFPRSLDGAPAVLPAAEMGLRRQLEHWFEANSIQPRVIAEVEDTALLTDLGAHGLGFVPVYSAVLDELARSVRLLKIGIATGLKMEVFAITAHRRLRHPAVVAMTAGVLSPN